MMNREEIEKKINQAISTSVPNVLDNILSNCEETRRIETVEKKKIYPKLFFPRLISTFAMFIIVLFGIVGLNQYNQSLAVDSIIDFDVNPSIELKINKKEKVLQAIPLNEDGNKILGDMDLKNTDINVAVNAIIGSMLKYGYISIDSNSILISVKNDDAAKGNELQIKIAKEIDEMLKTNSINASILSQNYNNDDNTRKLAEENNLSEGKTELIKQILAANITDSNGNLIEFEELSKLTINELNLLVMSKQANLDNINVTGNASESSYIGKENAKNIAYSHAGILSDNITKSSVELDYDEGKLIYEIEFYYENMEYEYEIDAKTGEIIDIDKEAHENNTVIRGNQNNKDSIIYDKYDYKDSDNNAKKEDYELEDDDDEEEDDDEDEEEEDDDDDNDNDEEDDD